MCIERTERKTMRVTPTTFRSWGVFDKYESSPFIGSKLQSVAFKLGGFIITLTLFYNLLNI